MKQIRVNVVESNIKPLRASKLLEKYIIALRHKRIKNSGNKLDNRYYEGVEKGFILAMIVLGYHIKTEAISTDRN